ncbi:guanitoxin biosynthesis MBL fold metallo-hydrolase GntH [Roseibium sp.]|uniref:guanitoxin biosynthesis MBL fold metallo-hydrolase GntH n=1 Tax=Roseibium sp. TaxID=1936156 RepID=UPI003BAB4795
MTKTFFGFAALATAILSIASGPVQAQPSSTGVIAERGVYYPGTEALAEDEMRVTACGTGMPTVRPKQAAACWLVELGNGDKFLFDIGAQSMSRIAAMKIPFDYLDKVFIGHLHLDHMADLATLWIGGLKANRTFPLRVWGPSGPKPELGTIASMEHMQKMYAWEIASIVGKLDDRGIKIEVNEFDYTAVNEVIYDENGVVIRSIPAVHAIDGAVSFILEWNGLKFAYSSDTSPTTWWVKYTKGVDISVHESFAPPSTLIEKQNYSPQFALLLSTLLHTSPVQFGKLMALTEPRLAVAYHFFNDHDTLPEQLEEIRKVYDGPLAMAQDYMVFNITKDDIRVRMAVIDEDIWPSAPTRQKVAEEKGSETLSKFVLSGDFFMEELLTDIWNEANKAYGSDAKLPPGGLGAQ